MENYETTYESENTQEVAETATLDETRESLSFSQDNDSSSSSVESNEPTSENTQEVAETAETDVDSNREQAKLRRERELQQRISEATKEIQMQLESERRINSDFRDGMSILGVDGDAETQAIKLLAQAKGVTSDQLLAERKIQKAREQESNDSDKQYKHAIEKAQLLENLLIEQMAADDLREIQSAFPDDKVKSIDALGDDFGRLVTAGFRGAKAYQMLKGYLPKTPKSMGDIKSSSPEKSDYFSRESVEKMSDSEIERNHEKIKESMKKW